MTDVRHALAFGLVHRADDSELRKDHWALRWTVSSGRPWSTGDLDTRFADADSPDEVRAAVRRNIFYGADCLKLVADNSIYHYSWKK